MDSDEDISPPELAANNQAKTTVRIIFVIWLAVFAVVFAFVIWLVVSGWYLP